MESWNEEDSDTILKLLFKHILQFDSTNTNTKTIIETWKYVNTENYYEKLQCALDVLRLEKERKNIAVEGEAELTEKPSCDVVETPINSSQIKSKII